MIFTIINVIIIFFVSLILAIYAAKSELSVPEEVKKIKIKKRKKLFGVILFLKEKIIHYSSSDVS